jgi:taurine dioxygenase
MTDIEQRTIEPFGVELDIDLAHDFSDDAADGLRAAFARHDLVLLRNQSLSFDEHVRVCAALGPVLMSDSGVMSRETVIGLAGVELCFHSDYGYSPEPLLGISLLAKDVVDGETSTRFASGRAAYASLDDDTRRHLARCRTLQVFGARLDARNRRDQLDPVLPSTEHPLVVHDEHGAYLFAP